MEECLKTHFYSDETFMANWTVCETVCLCESDDIGAPVCPEFWIIKTLCFDVSSPKLARLNLNNVVNNTGNNNNNNNNNDNDKDDDNDDDADDYSAFSSINNGNVQTVG
jgi:hypothetical protein